MSAAVVLAIGAGLFFGLNVIVVRWALDRCDAHPMGAALSGIGMAAMATAVAAVATGQPVPSQEQVGWLVLVGFVAPGSSQGLFIRSIGAIGAARASVIIGMNPLFSVLLAIAFLDEGWRVEVMLGTALVVGGGVLIGWEPGPRIRQAGVVLGLLTAALFGIRDVAASELTSGANVSTLWAATILLGAAAIAIGTIGLVQLRGSLVRAVRESWRWHLPSAAAMSIAIPLLLAGLERGRVGLVAPVTNATQSVAVIGLGSALFGVRERSPRVVLALALVVAGGALITSG